MSVIKSWATSLQNMGQSQFELYKFHIDHHLAECYVITPCEEVMTVIHVHS